MDSSEAKDKIISWGKSLTFKGVVILVLVITTVGLALATSSYKSKSRQLQVALDARKTTEEIERDNAKLESNTKELERLRSKLEKRDEKLLYLFSELDRLKTNPNTRTEVMNELGDINDTQDICNAAATFGYHICD